MDKTFTFCVSTSFPALFFNFYTLPDLPFVYYYPLTIFIITPYPAFPSYVYPLPNLPPGGKEPAISFKSAEFNKGEFISPLGKKKGGKLDVRKA